MTKINTVGGAAEELASKYLQGLGYNILARNLRTKFYEIDIVAQDCQTLVLIEVKFRSNFYGETRDLLPQKRRSKLLLASKDLMRFWSAAKAARIDLILVESGAAESWEIKHLKDVLGADFMI